MSPTGGGADPDPRPIARLRLRKALVAVPRERAPVFHFFEEMYARQAHRPAHDPASAAANGGLG